jgi:spore germination protein YaaH
MKKNILCLLPVILLGCYSPPVQPNPEIPVTEQIETIADEEELTEEFVLSEFELPPPNATLPVSNFKEIWAYLVAGRESALNLNYPITDLVYFGAEVDFYGKLVDIPNYRNISSFRGRKHFVAACNSGSLTHFVLMEGSNERKALIRDLLEAARPYDGLQIDFEYIPLRDGEAFLSFLREIRSGLGSKIFSIALKARTRAISDDVYDYNKIKPIVDRILVMAYDEHWSTSEPGPVASMGWCQRVASYSLDTIGTEKLIMGLPFYGRSWASENLNVAYVHSTVERVMNEQNVKEVQRESGIPYFKYTKTLSATVYYEDAYSLSARLDMYKKAGVNQVGFWRLGQETGEFWSVIGLENTDL